MHSLFLIEFCEVFECFVVLNATKRKTYFLLLRVCIVVTGEWLKKLFC